MPRPGAHNTPLSNMAMEKMLRRMKRPLFTASAPASAIGRANVSNFPREITETALAHVLVTRPNWHTVEVTHWRSAASSWMRGPRTVSPRLARVRD